MEFNPLWGVTPSLFHMTQMFLINDDLHQQVLRIVPIYIKSRHLNLKSSFLKHFPTHLSGSHMNGSHLDKRFIVQMMFVRLSYRQDVIKIESTIVVCVFRSIYKDKVSCLHSWWWWQYCTKCTGSLSTQASTGSECDIKTLVGLSYEACPSPLQH